MNRAIVTAAVGMVIAAGWMSAAFVFGQDAGKAAPAATPTVPAPVKAAPLAPVTAPAAATDTAAAAPVTAPAATGSAAPLPPAPVGVTPPAQLPPVEIPPIPEVGTDPFKPGPAPIRKVNPDVLEEGKRIFNREGRIEKDAQDHLVFVFDSGDKPMRILENSWREYMETRTDRATKQAHWRVSGIVMVYEGNNYILLTKAVHMLAEDETL